MTQQEKMEILVKTGALTEGHFLIGSSHRHTGRMVQLARLFENPTMTRLIISDLVQQLSELRADHVLGPALGGIIPAYELACQLGAANIFCERENGKMTLRRGFEIRPGARVLIAEDVITTGGSLREVLSLVRTWHGVPVGIAAIANLSGVNLDFGVPLLCAVHLPSVSYDAQDCPYCKQNIPLRRPASRSV